MRVSSSVLAVVSLCAPALAQVTEMESVNSAGVGGDYGSLYAMVSADGRYVAFSSYSTNLGSGGTPSALAVYLRDRLLGITETISLSSTGGIGAGYSTAVPSSDGRFVAFSSSDPYLVPGDTNGTYDAFVRDRQLSTTERVTFGPGGVQGNDLTWINWISDDGRYVTFESLATNVVPGDTNGFRDIFFLDRQLGTAERISVDSGGAQADGDSTESSTSADGRYIAFTSNATNLVPGDTNGVWDVFVHDRQTGTTERVNVDSAGMQANDTSQYGSPQISADGRFVAFATGATNLVPGDTNGVWDVFVHDRQTGTTERVSVDSSGTEGNYYSWQLSISADARYVAFMSGATNLVPGDSNGTADIFVHDRLTGATERVSVNSDGVQGDDASSHAGSGSTEPSISADGRYVAFQSHASNLAQQDANGGYSDVFLHDRASTGFTSLCDPGVNGVIACPCSNPPSALGRGCDNSSGTGGAVLSASGAAYLSVDRVVFTTSGERPTATSILMQGTATPPSGILYGQGVRCVGGSLKRLFTKAASAGSITAPDFTAGDPTISARSAAKGDVIQAGQSRWYLVYYRDPNVLGGCPAGSTLNATQTGRVTWWP